MAEIAGQIGVSCPPDMVWAVLADFDGISRWAPNVDHSCPATGQRAGVGAIRRVQVGRNALLERVIEWESGRHLAYSIEGLPPIVRSVTNVWQLEGSDGSTTVTLTSRIDAGPRPPQEVAARLFGRVLAKASREMLGGLKTHLEGVPR
ncbi:MAG: SRPBCC family protein [Acidimicrobiales bacterium]